MSVRLPDANGWFSAEHPPVREYDAQGKWILHEYLVFCASSGKHVAKLINAADSALWNDAHTGGRLSDVTHWQPLPGNPVGGPGGGH